MLIAVFSMFGVGDWGEIPYEKQGTSVCICKFLAAILASLIRKQMMQPVCKKGPASRSG
jgi:hypothetical protein